MPINRMSMEKYVIVAFLEEDDTVAVVLAAWLINSELCYWPPYTSQDRKNKAAINCEIPSEKWSKHSCRILGTKDSYAKARSELGKAEITSDLQSDVDVSRLRTKHIQKYLEDDNDNSDEYFDKNSQQKNKQPLCQVSKKREGSAEGSNSRSKTKSHRPAPKAPPFPVSSPCSLTPSSPVISERAIPESISQPFTRAIERGSELSTSHVASQQFVTPATTSSWQSATSTSAACYRTSTHAASELHTISWRNLEDISFVSAGAFIEGELEQVIANLVPNIPTSLSIPATSLNAIELSTAASHTSAQTSNSVLNKIFTLLVELKSEVANLQKQTIYNTTMLQTLSQGGIQDDGNIFETLDLPVCDRKQLQQLEDIITKDNLLFNKLVHGVASKGGQDLKEAVRRIVSSLMENDVVKQMNWSGLGENLKKPFRDLKCRQVLERALRRNPPTKGASESDVQKAVVHYLAGASDRNGGRKQRAIRQSIKKTHFEHRALMPTASSAVIEQPLVAPKTSAEVLLHHLPLFCSDDSNN
ncbi:uncharacterized protein LOC100198834 isoform X2 [Hydra vulgaris]|uniref:uncharacterized protein LOC100198834 isoform X2 n=1 Tax=Hydra vulgaris TaxID=6087 RepID=UPI0032EA214C